MAVYRQVHTTFWQDPFILDNLDYKEKYFYLYLMTNSKTRQCGIYEISEGVMMLETGLKREEIKAMLEKLKQHKKIEYNPDTKEIFLINWAKYNPVNNRNMEKCILKELQEVKSEEFKNDFIGACIALDYKIPTIEEAYKGLIRAYPTPTKQKEKEKEKEKEEEKEEGGDQLQQLNNLWMDCGYGMLNPNTVDKLEADIEIFSFPWVKEAIEIGNARGKRSYSYMRGILNKWKSEGKENEPRRSDKKDSGSETDYSTAEPAEEIDFTELI